jgi:hypothetical protein
MTISVIQPLLISFQATSHKIALFALSNSNATQLIHFAFAEFAPRL